MAKIKQLIRNIRKLTPERQTRELLKIIKRNKKQIAKLNADQMYAGIKSNGSRITPGYKESTKKRKIKKGQPTNRVTLRDTGKFHNDIFIDADNAPVLFSSHDGKTSDLVEKYGEEIFGLTKKNKEFVYREIVGKDYRRFINNILRL